MKQLVRKRMSPKSKPKKKVKQKLTQKEKFIEYAKKLEADESGETFKKALNKIVHKNHK